MAMDSRLSTIALFLSILLVVTRPATGYRPTGTTSTQLFAKRGKTPVRNALTPAQRILNQQKKDEPDEAKFDQLKNKLYDFGDGLSNLSNKLSSENKPTVKGGYTDKKASKTNPTLRILENLQRPKAVEEPPPSSGLDSVKNAIYGTADKITIVAQQKKEQEKSNKPASNARLERSKQVLEVLPDLKDPNPIKRFSAEWKIKDLELQENIREKQQQVTSTVDNIKSAAYALFDFFKSAVAFLQKLPDRIQNSIRKILNFVESVPGVVEETVETVTSIPAKVEQKTDEIQTSVTKTVKKTQQTIDDVKAIPSKVQQNVETTKENVKSAVNTVEEVSTNIKVLLGLEKPVPKPPKKPPPKPATGADLAKDVLGTVASGAGKAAWWVTKGTAGLAFKATKAGAEKVKDEATSKIKEATQAKTSATTNEVAASFKPASKPLSKPPKAEILDAPKVDLVEEKIDEEVTETLRLAKEALEESTTKKNEEKGEAKLKNDNADKQEPRNKAFE